MGSMYDSEDGKSVHPSAWDPDYWDRFNNRKEVKYKAPKKTRSWRTCPNCGSLSTNALNLNEGLYACRSCYIEYDFPTKENT